MTWKLQGSALWSSAAKDACSMLSGALCGIHDGDALDGDGADEAVF